VALLRSTGSDRSPPALYFLYIIPYVARGPSSSLPVTALHTGKKIIALSPLPTDVLPESAATCTASRT
jgi:hypothetical protein